MCGDVAACVATFLDAHHVMSLATGGPDGPRATNVLYVRDGFSLLWLSERDTRHSMAIESQARVSATVAADHSDFDKIRGLQIFGDAHRIVDAAERLRGRGLLEARYPMLQRLSDRPSLKRTYETAALYRLAPHQIVLIDNTRGFGHKDTLDFSGTARLTGKANQ
jgi:uncharacterized protein YhbP (UPF0306 family)